MVIAKELNQVWERFPSAEDLKPRHPICDAAEMAHISPATLSRYEAAGLLVPHRNGRRLYSDDDVRWMRCIHYLLSTWGLTVEKLRRLLSTVHCFDLTHCPTERQSTCTVRSTGDQPCWMIAATTDDRQCYICPTYRLARHMIWDPADLERAQTWQPSSQG